MIAVYLRHENYNRIWCLIVKLFAICTFQTQNLEQVINVGFI